MLTQPEGMVGLLWRFSKGEEKATPARRRKAKICTMGFISLFALGLFVVARM
jgi:succinate dehydrogenase/fumarate reductase cytochrome b subunit